MIFIKTLKLSSKNQDELLKACQLILQDEVVAIPTETVYGLGANALSSTAVSKIFKAKGRPQDNPLIVHVCSMQMLEKLVLEVSDVAKKVIDEFWPGALTIIFKKSDIVPSEISCGLDTVAIRFPKHETALKIIENCDVPIAAPSANLSGRPSTTTAQHVFSDLDGKISAIVFDIQSELGVESTVLDLTQEIPTILRPGGVTKEQLEKVLGKVNIDVAVHEKINDTKKVSSPGMKYRHYAPKAKVTVLCGNEQDTANYIKVNACENSGILCFDEFENFFDNKNLQTFGSVLDVNLQAKNLFDKLRNFDQMEILEIFAQCPHDEGLGSAVVNRLKKASGFNVIDIKKRKILGLTGASGSGKSTVSEIFTKLLAKVINADEIYHNLLETCTDMKNEICENFDLKSNDIDRKQLGKIVFSDKDKLLKLNEITHKYITKEFERILYSTTDYDVIVLDVPLLFEANYQKYCDKVVGIVANEEQKINRLCTRDEISQQYAKKRLENQKNNEFFIENCDIIIDNNGDFDMLYEKCQKIYNEIGE